MIITIDGPSGTGKSTVARNLAEKLGFIFFDTGAMYRSVAWLVLERNVDISDQNSIENVLKDFKFDFSSDEKGIKRYFVNGIEVTRDIRTPEVTEMSSKIAAIGVVRKNLIPHQRNFAKHSNTVFEGRDMGTVVFPEADLKIFLTAKAEIRAERRCKELKEKFPNKELDYKTILVEIHERDKRDSSREISPLRKAEDAILIDTSQMSLSRVVQSILRYKDRIAPTYLPMKVFYRAVLFFAKCIFKIFYRHRIYGKEHYVSGAALIAANHVSYFDPPAIAVSCPEEVQFLARDSLFKKPIFGYFIRKLNAHPVSNQTSDAHVFRKILHLLEKGNKVILFPEGTRMFTPEIGMFQQGIGFLVSKSHCPILPVYVHGTYKVWGRKRKFPKIFGKIACVFGKPIEWDEFSSMDRKEAIQQITLKTEQSLKNLKKWYESGKKGSPP